MKIERLHIKNYRSLKNVVIKPKDILALVGKNNTGKSNVFKALQLFFEASKKYVDEECFYNHNCENPIEITVKFNELTNWEKSQFEEWLNGEKLIVSRKISCESEGNYNIDTYAIASVPEPEWLQKDMICGDEIEEWWDNKENLKIAGLDFCDYLGTSKPLVGEWKEEAENFINDHRDKISFKKRKLKNPRGYKGTLKKALPEYIYIPAVRHISDETKVAKSNPFGKLINSILNKISQEKKQIIEEKIRKVELVLNRGQENERLEEIENIESELDSLVGELMDCDVEIKMNMPSLDEVFGEAEIYADDGVRTSIETKGHGLQRTMIISILRAYSEFINEQKIEDEDSDNKSVMFVFEEPELYLHPQAQRTLMNVLRKIASGSDQVLYTTHSSQFVDIMHFDQICIMRKENKNGELQSVPSQLPMSALIEDFTERHSIEPSKIGMRELHFNAFNSMINEGFFADKVVIVEGNSEKYSLPIYAKQLNYDLDKHNVAVVHSNGKGSMDRLLRIFNGFKIPTYVWFDGDKSKSDEEVKRKTKELLNLLGDPIENVEEIETKLTENYAVLKEDLETTLKSEMDDYDELIDEAGETLGPTGKPLKQKYIATQLMDKVKNTDNEPEEIFPETIIKIIRNIEETTYDSSILRSAE